MDPTSDATERFDLGAAFLRALNLFIDNLPLFLPLTILAQTFSILAAILVALPQGGGIPLLVTVFTLWAGSFIMSLALMHSVARRSDGAGATFQESLLFGAEKFLPSVAGVIIFEVLFLAGLFLLVLPGLYFLVVFSMFLFALLFEDKGIWAAFLHSRELIRGFFWRMAGIQAAVLAVFLVISFCLVAMMKLLGLPSMVRLVVSSVINAIAMPLLIGLYYQVFLFLKQRHTVAGRIAVYEVKEEK